MRFVDVEHRGIEPHTGLPERNLGRPFFYAENEENGSTVRLPDVFNLRDKTAYLQDKSTLMQKKVYTKFTRTSPTKSIYFSMSRFFISSRALM